MCGYCSVRRRDRSRTLEAYAGVEEGGKTVFRYMKAIPTAKLCLACHGTNIDPDAAEALKTHDPNGRAIGCRQGDIRGAFTITQPD